MKKKIGSCLGALSAVLFLLWACGAEAGVTLKPRVSEGGSPPADGSMPEDFVYFGRYAHWSGYVDGQWDEGNTYEPEFAPILWRVMSTDISAKRATLLSHYVLESNRYHDTDEGNTWKDSRMQLFLNSTEDSETAYQRSYDERTARGFLHSDHFSVGERVAMPSPSPDDVEDSVVTLPSLDDVNGRWFIYGGGNASRQATLVDESYGAEPYWLRTPAAGDTANAYNVDDKGGASTYYTFAPLGIRPVFFLKLESLIFKSASDFSPSAGAAGSRDNPYLLYLPAVPKAALAPSSADVSGAALAVKFAQPVAHAYADAEDEAALGGKFAVTKGGAQIAVTKAAVRGDTVTLTLQAPIAYGDTGIKVSYAQYDASDTGGIGFYDGSGTLSILNGFAAADVNNVTPQPGNPEPGDPLPVSLSSLLLSLNAALLPHTVTPLTALSAEAQKAIADFGVASPAPVSKVLGTDASFIKKTSPTLPLEEYINLLPSFSSSVSLNSNTAGNVLALSFSLDLTGLEGFENWKSLNNNARVALLNALNVVLAYEYTSSWPTLVGAAPSAITWGEALAAGIATFSESGLSFRYAVLDGAGDPFVAGDIIAIPDGSKDSKLTDPVWLMRRTTDTPPIVVLPTSITLSPSAATVREEATVSVTATVRPEGTTDKTLLWSVGDTDVAKIESTAIANVWRVSGLSEGVTELTATASSDRTVKQTLSVTVEAKDGDGSSSGCSTAALPFSLLLLCPMFAVYKRGAR